MYIRHMYMRHNSLQRTILQYSLLGEFEFKVKSEFFLNLFKGNVDFIYIVYFYPSRFLKFNILHLLLMN